MRLSYWEQESLATTDIIIVGAGIVGLSLALDLQKARPNLAITVLERGVFPSGASSRNAGFACIGSLTEILVDIKRMGEGAALEQVARRFAGLKLLRARFTDAAIGYEASGNYELLPTRAPLEHLTHINKLLTPIVGAPPFAIVEKHPFLGHTVLHNHLEGQLNSGWLMRALLQQAMQQGIRILTGAHVRHVGNNEVEISDPVTLVSFRIHASRIALCANAGLEHLAPSTGIVPGRGQVIVTAPISQLPWRGAFHMHEGFYYFRNIGDRVLVGGGRHLDFNAEQTHDLTPSTPVMHALEDLLRNIILPQREITIEHRHVGTMGFSPNKKPVVQASGNVVTAFGCNGMGVALGSLVAQEACALLTQ